MHHIISDGTTKTVISNFLNNYYNNKIVEEPEIQFSDYAFYRNEMKNSEWYAKQIEFYRDMFKENYEVTNIPHKEKVKEYKNDGNDKEVKDEIEIGHYTKYINNLISDKVNEFIRVNKISKTIFFLSIYGYVLSKYSGQDVIYSSIMTSNRSNQYVENMIGMFVSTQPILLKYNQTNGSFLDIIKENMENLIKLYNNQDISFSELTNTLKLKKVNNAFVFQPKIIVENDYTDESIFLKEENDKIYSVYESINELQLNKYNKARFDIAFNAIESDDGYLLTMEYNKNIYESSIIQNIINSCFEVIQHLDKFNSEVQEIEYIPKEEIDKIITKFNDNDNKFDKEGTKLYYEEFSRVAKMYPEKCAIVFNETKITYKELDEMTNSLAYYLREQNNIQRNDIIPIICDRSPLYIIGILGISKSGGAYLPIDPKLPNERIKYILDEVHPKIVLFSHSQKVIEKLNKDVNYKTYDLEIHNYKLNIHSINTINEVDDTCYVLFTSGTTGKPKGTLISHFNLYNHLRSFQNDENNYSIYNLIFKSNNIQNVLGITNFSFDPSHDETINSLIHGFKLVLVDDNISNNIPSLSKYIIENDVDYIQITPTRLKLFMENEEFRKCIRIIKAMVLGGEALSIDLCKYIHQYSDCRIYNEYGPTECTVACTGKMIDERKENKINIGKPFCNCKIYILDKYMKPVPIGIEGEICIGGYGVGKGYLNREELTKEKFIENPFNDENDDHNRIMYRTGDLGKWTLNGEIEYLGRSDFQVKIHGQRIELEEIETTVNEIDEIKQNVVIDRMNDNGDKYLICYFVGEEKMDARNIQEYLKKKLPQYMIPNYFKQIERFEITNNGKLDKKALPEPDIEDLIKEEYVAAETEIEKIICD
eukprot:jgi/Orpsp1_1/1187077/evm.model.d7180000055271.1